MTTSTRPLTYEQPTTTTTRPLTYEQFVTALATLPPLRCPGPIHNYYTPHATQDHMVTRTWKERLLTLPWQPRQIYKIQSQPAIYLVNVPFHRLSILPPHPQRNVTFIVAHPSFQHQIEKALEGRP